MSDHPQYLKVFISGVSSGIGYATADFFLKQGHTVIGTVRKIDDAAALRSQYPQTFFSFVGDLTQFEHNEKIPDFLNEKKINTLDVLINNAGLALAAPIEYQNFSEIQYLVHLNVLSVIQLTQLLLPFLKKSKISARIINISSVSGVGGTPFLGAYCATKHAIEGFSESLRRELKIYGMKVVIVGPGSIKTPIWDKGFKIVSERYQNTEYANSFAKFIHFASYEKENALEVSDVVSCIHQAVIASSPAYRYAPVPRKLTNWYLPMIIPQKIYDYLMCKTLGLVSHK